MSTPIAEVLLEQCRDYVEQFAIREDDLVAESYSDMKRD